MSPSDARRTVKRRGRTIPLVAVVVSLALHGLAIASIVGWPDGQAPDAPPQIIAVGMVFAEQQASDLSEVAVSHEASPSPPTNQDSVATVEETIAVEEPPPLAEPVPASEQPIAEPVPIEQPSPALEPVPPFVEGTQLALSEPRSQEPEDAPPDPFVFFDEGTVLIDRSPDVAPGLPTHRPMTPIAFQPVEPPAAEPPEPPAPAPPAPQPTAQNPPATAPGPSADQPSDSQPATPSVMAVQPALYTGPGLANPGPEYPRSARRRGDEGTVVLRVTVSATGLPQQIQIRSSSGFQTLDQAAIEAVEGWRFIAARRGDIAVAATIDVPIAFRLTAD
ncbi:MAG: TonB family protein [Pseudomonadota bacterium]